MFSSIGLFQNLSCPEGNACTRPTCIFSHRSDLPPPLSLHIPIDEPKPVAPSSAQSEDSNASTVPAKRSALPPPSLAQSANGRSTDEPPRKIQKLSLSKKAPVHSVTHTPVMSPMSSYFITNFECRPVFLFLKSTQCNLKLLFRSDRFVQRFSYISLTTSIQMQCQAMVKSLYDHFTVLYEAILPSHPTLASDHALKQEDEVYKIANKMTYRNVWWSDYSIDRFT